MVWCARESADFKPGESNAMQLFEPYGWIHWGGATWHTVTGYELGEPLKQVIKSQVSLSAAFALENPAFEHANEALSDPGPDGDAEVDVDAPPAAAAACRRSAAAGPAAGPPPPASHDQPSHRQPSHRLPTRRRAQATQLPGTAITSATVTGQTPSKRLTTHGGTRSTPSTTPAGTRATHWRTPAGTPTLRSSAPAKTPRWPLTWLCIRQFTAPTSPWPRAHWTVPSSALPTSRPPLARSARSIRPSSRPATRPVTRPRRAALSRPFLSARPSRSRCGTWRSCAGTRGTSSCCSPGRAAAPPRRGSSTSWNGASAESWPVRGRCASQSSPSRSGLALLPIGLVQLSSGSTDLIGFAALAVLVLWLVGELIVARRPPDLTSRPSKPSRLAPRAPELPAAPTGGFDRTGPRAYGLDDDPPAPPQRAADVNPPAPPDPAGLPEPPAPLPGPLAAGPRPAPPQQAPSPTELKVDLRLGVDRPGRH